jgi:nitrate reductase gamma subunit
MGKWLIPVTHIYRASPAIGVLSFLFHIGLILVPIFLAEHVMLWRQGTGVGWAALPPAVADGLTILTIATGVGLLGFRVFGSAARFMSQGADYFLLALLLVPFVSGLLASHPAWNPFSYQSTMLVHVLAGDLVMGLMPFTKLSHAVLFPFERMSSEVYWRFPAGAGDRVAGALHGKEPAVL